ADRQRGLSPRTAWIVIVDIVRTLGTIVAVLIVSLPVSTAAQNCGWSHIDHLVSYHASGAWNPNVERGIFWGLTIAEVGGAIWEGSETRFGKTMWQGIDSEILAGIGTQ